MTGCVICECNPLHEGHMRLLRAMRKKCKTVIAVLGDCFTQRGEPALVPTKNRAECLLQTGLVDLVVTLPFPFCASRAEQFARGVEIGEMLGCDTLWFGSECGDMERLKRTERLVKTKPFQIILEEKKKTSDGTATAFYDALTYLTDITYGSNDILALSYLARIGNLEPRTIKREGMGHRMSSPEDGEKPTENTTGEGLPSAGFLRNCIEQNGLESVKELVPPFVYPVLQSADLSHSDKKLTEVLRQYFLFAKSPVCNKDATKDLVNRFQKMAKQSKDGEEWFTLCKTKKYPDSRIRRAMLSSFLGVTEADYRLALYTRLLGYTRRGLLHLNRIKKTCRIPIVTKQKDFPAGFERQKELEEKAHLLYALCSTHPEDGLSYIREIPLIQDTIKEKR